MGSPLEVLANYNPTGFALANQQRQAQLAQTQAQTQAIAPQIQATQLENQIRIRQLKDQDALTRAWGGVDSSADPASQERQLEQGIIQNGGSANAVLGMRANFADFRIKNATATKDEAANNAARHDELAGIVNGITEAPEEQKQALWQQYAPQIQSHLNPGETVPAAYPGDDQAKALSKVHLYLSAQSKIQKEQAETGEAQAKTLATEQQTRLRQEAEDRQAAARANPNDPTLQRAAMDAKEAADFGIKQLELAKQTAQLNEEIRRNRTNEGLSAQRNAISQGRLAQEQLVNGIKYSPDTVEYWVKTLQDNPDAVKEVPADIKGTVGKAFRIGTGLPLPVPLEGTLKQNETNAGTSIENINRIRQLVADPEIQSRLGPILGRLGNVEQRVGTAAGLSPQAEEKAQELRTLMRYFVFQEGKTILGGRLPRQLMGELQSSSANTHMDAPTLAGALNGAEAQANTVRDNAERARFGGQMRPQSMRTGPGANQTTNLPTVTTQEQFNALPRGAIYLEDGKQYRKP